VELLKRAAKIDLTSLPFAGSAQGITNLLGGHVNFAMASDVAAVPWSKGGTFITEENVQLLCARHNLQKHDRIV
jgi:tripartite-type tricarboxylate transporter receptor subunit TctC